VLFTPRTPDFNSRPNVSVPCPPCAFSKGLNILFAGISGTGKTMTEEVVANPFLIGFYKIALFYVAKKYIGETEKNLTRVFREIRTRNGILLFDEADGCSASALRLGTLTTGTRTWKSATCSRR
jgi:SpoVK/Ycf46/Vps4 family AAA+-type ATPase